MANTLRFKRGLVSGIPTAALGEPLFTTDTFDLYIGNGTGNTRFQKYIASGATTQILRGDGSLYTFPLNISSPSNGQVLKYNGTSWVNDSDAGITGSGAAGQVAFFTGATTQGGSNNLFWDSANNRLGIGTATPTSIGIGLEIYDNTLGGTLRLSRDAGNARGQIQFGRNNAGTFQVTGQIFNGSDTSSINNGYLTFSTSNSSGTLVEYVRINGLGYVGIGTNNPATPLEINGTTFINTIGSTTSRLLLRNSTTGTSTGGLDIRQIGVDASFNNTSNGYISFSTNNTERARLHATGNLHLGGSSDNGLRFQVTGDASVNGNTASYIAQLNQSNTTAGASFGTIIRGGTNVSDSALRVQNAAQTANLLTVQGNGSLGLGTTLLTGYNVRINKTITGSAVAYGIDIDSAIQSDVTNSAVIYGTSVGTQATAFTLSNLFHYNATQGTFGAGSAVTSQFGFRVSSNMIGATNNYGFYGDIASGTGRWNLYMNGSAQNYLNGGLAIAGTTLNANALLQINANAFNDNRVILISNTNAGTSAQAAIQLTSNAGTASFNVYSSAFGITEFASTALLSSGLMANGLLLNTSTTAPIVFRTNSTERMRLDASGNLGLGVTPSAWISTAKAMQVGSASFVGVTGTSDAFAIGGNYYINSSNQYVYLTSTNANRFEASLGEFRWLSTGSGTAGDIFTFTQRMTLTAAGRLLLGSGAATSELMQVNGTMRVSGASYLATSSGNVGIGTTNAIVYIDGGNGKGLSIQNAGRAGIRISDSTAAVQNFDIGINGNTAFISAIYSATPTIKYQAVSTHSFETNSIERFSISGTGAATFSSSVTAGGNLLLTNGTASSVGAINLIRTGASPVASRLTFGTDGTGYSFAIGKNQGGTVTDLLTILDSGAATFSSSIQASTAIAIGTTPDTNKPFKILKNINGTVGINFENTSTGANAFSAIQMGTDVTGGTAFTNLVYSSSGVTAAGVYQPSGTSLINTGSGGLNFLSVSQPIRFFTSTGNGTERVRIKNEGQVHFVPLAAAPTTNVQAGDVYYDSTLAKLRCYDGIQWQDLF